MGSTENLPSGRNTKTVPPAPRFHHETNNLLQMKNNAASAFASHSDSNNAAARVNAAAAMQSQCKYSSCSYLLARGQVCPASLKLGRDGKLVSL